MDTQRSPVRTRRAPGQQVWPTSRNTPYGLFPILGAVEARTTPTGLGRRSEAPAGSTPSRGSSRNERSPRQ
eukprot:371353-Alexandrium_andersonii.AAC.1